jgi:hypothetical protein
MRLLRLADRLDAGKDRPDPTQRCFSGAGAEPTRSTEQK